MTIKSEIINYDKYYNFYLTIERVWTLLILTMSRVTRVEMEHIFQAYNIK